METKFTIPIRDEQIEVTHEVRVDKDSARNWFSARIGGKYLRGDTLDALRTKLMNETKRQAVKVEIPFCIIITTGYRSDYAIRKGVITSLHAGTGKPLVRWDDGKAEQLDGYNVLKPLDEATAAELLQLKTTQARIVKRINELERANGFSVREAVDAAVSEASGTERER